MSAGSRLDGLLATCAAQVQRLPRLGGHRDGLDDHSGVPTREDVEAAVAGDVRTLQDYGSCTLAVVEDEDGRRLYRVSNEASPDGEWSINLAILGSIRR